MKTQIRFAIYALVLPLCLIATVYAGDGFEAVRCGADIPKALIGRKTANEPVVKIEARHKDIGLKDLGADIISDDERLNLIFWQICGDEYAVLEEGDVVKDALKFPKHSKDSPQFDGQCQLNGKDLPYYAVGVLKNEEGATMLPAVAAWMIDEKKKKFVPLQTEGLRCSRDGITTADGGK
ncbi:MAG TPA: hypothetical protein VKS98_08695 [Chthoniobacterales bacterium]|nr:hypothetical protein [Chthoniobacterales bacterium]